MPQAASVRPSSGSLIARSVIAQGPLLVKVKVYSTVSPAWAKPGSTDFTMSKLGTSSSLTKVQVAASPAASVSVSVAKEEPPCPAIWHDRPVCV